MLERLGGREKVVRSLCGVVVVGVVVWIATEAAFQIYFFTQNGFSQTLTSWVTWAQIASRLAYDVWLGALALLLLIWLSERLLDAGQRH